MRKLLGLFSLAAVFFACSPGYPASAVCKQDSDCADKLTCVPFAISNNGVCTASTDKTCTQFCTTDADCASLKGPDGQGGFTCFHCGDDSAVRPSCGKLAH